MKRGAVAKETEDCYLRSGLTNRLERIDRVSGYQSRGHWQPLNRNVMRLNYPVKELMNLERLQWTKNVKDSDGWAYCEFEKGELFKLAWRNDEANANRLERDDLILLRQQGYVTHIVKVLNRQAERDDDPNVFNIYRIVEVVWAIGSTNPPSSARADIIFDYPEVLKLQGGNVMKLEDLPTFKDAWDSRGGIATFQAHVQSKLAAI